MKAAGWIWIALIVAGGILAYYLEPEVCWAAIVFPLIVLVVDTYYKGERNQ